MKRLLLILALLVLTVPGNADYQYISSYEGVAVNGQCVVFVQRWAPQVLGVTVPLVTHDTCAHWIWDDSSLQPTNTDRIANDGTNYPQRWDIIVWCCLAGGCGHVGIVDSARNRDDVLVVDSNWENNEKGIKHTVNLNNVLGWFRKKVSGCDTAIGQDSIEQSHFQLAYDRNGGQAKMGCPFDGGGGKKTHWWNGIVIQDFNGGSYGRCAIIDNQGTAHDTAYVVRGGIWDKWGVQGAASPVGRPISDEAVAGTSPWGTTGYYQTFDNGAIHASPKGCWFTYGTIYQRYGNAGGSSGHLGFPVNDPYAWNGVLRQDYEGGYLTDGSPANVWWTSTPVSDRWYRSNEFLQYSYSGSNVNVDEWPHVGSFDGMYLAEAGIGWHEYGAHVWNEYGDVTIRWNGGWDDQAPRIWWSEGCPPRSQWLNVKQQAGFRWEDTASGVKGDVNRTYCRWNGGQKLAEYDGWVDIPEGINTLEVRCEDDAWTGGSHDGNVTTLTGEFRLDTTSPVVTVTLSPSAPNGENDWYTINPTLSISATDPNGSNGSGIDKQFYSIDSGSDLPYTTAALVAGDGVHSCKGKAVDYAGNSGEAVVSLKVDTTAAVFSSINTAATSASLDTLTAAWDCADTDSGVAVYEYSIYHRTGGDDDLLVGPIVTANNWAYQSSLGLQRGEIYFFLVRAKNNAGLYSSLVASQDIVATEDTRDVAPSLNSGGISVPEEARTSPNYMLVDSIGQFAVDTSASSGFVVESGYWHSEVSTIDTPTVSFAKSVEDNKLIQLGSPEKPVVVTMAPSTFADRFYVEQPDRSSGVAVQFGAGLTMSLVPGDRVWILGTPNTIDGERVIQYAAPTLVTHDSPLGALFISNNWLGGSDLNTLTLGADGASGPNNIGILIKTCGRIKQVDPDGYYFYIDDGSALCDGTNTGEEANIGVRIAADGRSYTADRFVTVTGISSCFTGNDGKLKRLVRPLETKELQ